MPEVIGCGKVSCPEHDISERDGSNCCLFSDPSIEECEDYIPEGNS